jgi:tetratricopeptide (TPR) repeat protein/KaiC/GvpD/RAD55 family RecA-like ATPase
MSKGQSLQRILAQAEEKVKKYDWLDAIVFYKKALDQTLKRREFSKAGEIQERIGFCLHRAAMQAESQEEFKERMRRAVEAYKEAHGFYEKPTDEQKSARMFRCKAITKYLGYWLTPDPSEKRKLLDECLELIGKASVTFSETGDMLEYGRTYNSLPLLFFLRVILEWDKRTSKSIVQRGLEWGEKANSVLSELNVLYEIARANFTLATCLIFLEGFIQEPEEKEVNRLRVVNYLRKAADVSESVGDTYLSGWAHILLGANTGEEESWGHFEKTLECGEQTRDNFLVAAGHDLLAYMTYWKALATEDPDQRRKLTDEAMQSYDEAQHHLSILELVNPRGVFMRLRARARAPPASRAAHYLQLSTWETDREKRREFLDKAEKAWTEDLNIAEQSNIPYAVLYVLHVASKTLEAQARMEPNPAKKRSRLEKALKYRKRAIEILEQLAPFDYYEQGVMQNYVAGIKAELADVKADPDGKIKLLEKAVLRNEECLNLCDKMVPYFERMGDVTFFVALQMYQDTYATLLKRLYDLTSSPEHLRKAILIQQKAIESARKLGMVSLIAESYWKIGEAHDVLRNRLEAAQNYEFASENYMKAARKIPQLKDFYQDHASYMEAWSEIEKAKDHHSKREYGEAREHDEKAANLHKSTERWNHLTSNYFAWARLEEAEDLSRREHTEKARDLFQQAAKLFVEAKKAIEKKLEKIEVRDEREMAAKLVRASDIRREYCLGRVALEEAKIFDRRGDHLASSETYGSAAEKFQKTADGMEVESERQEIQPIIYLCRAWQMMTRAEAEAAPDLYLEASQLFEQAKEHSFDPRSKILALGHSRFCKALEAGTRFEDTRDRALYLAATQHLETAANYYVRAGFKMASEYAMATQRLFDAYVYMDDAKKEMDPEKKARLFLVAEKVLQTSIGSYLTAKYPAKSDQVQRLLEKVRAERELAVSLSEVLRAPTITSSTASFVTPTQAHERAVGLEVFEHASVRAKLILPKKEIRVGEDFTLEIQITNVGKEAVLVAKVEGFLPTGFELIAMPEKCCSFEDTYLDMKGIQLDPLKTEEIRIVLRSFSKGTFEMKPRIVYVGETGEQMVSELEPATIEILEVVLPDRIATGYRDLDALLFGGIPKNSAVILTSPSCDERDLLVNSFLKTELKKGEVTFHVTIDPSKAKAFAEEFRNFYLFICNPQADRMIRSLPNVFKLKGVENLTEINIALTSAFRRLGKGTSGPRRACFQIVSDVLLQHHAVQTRRWLSSLIPELKSRGFTMLAVIDPQMHPQQEVRAVLDLFEGEINLYEKETKIGPQKHLKIKKMANQKYLKSELSLGKRKTTTD